MATNTFTQQHETVYGNMRCVIGTLSWGDATTAGLDTTVALDTIYSVVSNHGTNIRYSGNAIGCEDATAGSTMTCMVFGI